MINNNTKLEVVIPIVKVDVPTFRNNLPYLLKYLPVKRVVLIGAKEIEPLINDLDNVEFQDENSIIPDLTLNKIKQIKKDISGTDRRSGWYYQQFLKMAYSFVCSDDYYLIWDSDTIPIKQMSFFDKDSGKPFLDYRDYVKYDECFFVTQNLLFPNEYLKKTLKWSFICEHLLVNSSIMRSLLKDLTNKGAAGKTTFYENVMHIIPRNLINLSGFSEFETYAAYVLKEYPDSHILRKWNNLRNAGIYIGHDLSESHTKWIAECYDVISVEDFNPQWTICKLFLRIDSKHRISFKRFSRYIQFFYNFIYDIRFKVRNIIKK